MSGERYVALGLATTRAAWFNDVARWATVGSAPIEFVKCISAEELTARLGSGRVFSVILIDAGTNAIDRDLLDLAANRKVPVVVVDDGRTQRDFTALGAHTVLPVEFSRDQLIDTLRHVSTMIGGATALPVADPAGGDGSCTRGLLFGVAGCGGTGASTVAIALAQGLATANLATADTPQGVVLADLCLDAEQAMLHDARDIVPGVQELVEAHRSGQPSESEIVGLTFATDTRGYRLLLGLRRHRDWTSLRPRSFESALGGLRRAFAQVVVDMDSDVEGEAATGSIEIEERNIMARTVSLRTDLLVVVGRPGIKGIHALVRTVNGFRDHGVAPARVLAVFNGAPRNPRLRAELSRSFADLTGATAGLAPVMGPVFLLTRRGLDDAHRDGTRLPPGLCRQVTDAVLATARRAEANAVGDDDVEHENEPSRIRPGSLGRWSEQEAAGQ